MNVVRQNFTVRIQMHRFTRLTNGLSLKVDNPRHAVGLHSTDYNFGRMHQILRVTPSFEAGVTNHIWSIEQVLDLLDGAEGKVAA